VSLLVIPIVSPHATPLLPPRWRKVRGDAAEQRGRLIMMLIAMAVGIFALGLIATAYAILGRELDAGYLATNPPAALLDVEPLDDAAVAGVRGRPGVVWAEAGSRVWGRIEVGPQEWLPLLLNVRPSFALQRIGKLELEQGQWPADGEGIVLERTAVGLANSGVGREVMVQSPSGSALRLAVTGIVHDPSLPPARQQQAVYGYVTPATLRALGETTPLRSLSVSTQRPAGDPAGSPATDGSVSGDLESVERTMVDVARWLQDSGYRIGEIRIPPRHHPHWGMMQNIVRLLLVLSVMTLALGAVLTATVTATLLASQTRQIGVMKAIGARGAQITQLYATLVGLIGLAAVALGLPLGIFAGRRLASVVMQNQNIDAANLSIPGWLGLLLAGAGVGLPLLFALIPIVHATRRPVREALNDYGVSPPPAVRRWMRGSRVTAAFPAATLGVQSSMRRKGRLMLTLGLLATAGALFIASLNILAAWRHSLIDARVERHADIEIQFAKPQPTAAAVAAVLGVPGTVQVESFSDEVAAPTRGDGLNITRTFPDGGHGSLRLHAVPVESAFLNPVLQSGRWLSPDRPDGAVLNLQALTFFPGLKLGCPIRVTVRGVALELRALGIIREHLAGATFYVSAETYRRALNEADVTGGLRVALPSQDERFAVAATSAVELSLTSAGISVASVTTRAQLGRALGGHLFMLIAILTCMAMLMAIVGLLGLGSTLGTSVLERAREFGVMRAIGAGDRSIRAVVLAEGLLIGVMSVVLAAVASVPLTWVAARVVGAASLGPARDTIVSAYSIPLWLAVVLAGATAASLGPVRKALRVTVREALAYQ
jgi:putative ABC transport system permease protein